MNQRTPAEVAEILKTITIGFHESVIEEVAAMKAQGKECYWVCEKWECGAPPNVSGGTVHCDCVKGHTVCK
jgi:hypothetical protein